MGLAFMLMPQSRRSRSHWDEPPMHRMSEPYSDDMDMRRGVRSHWDEDMPEDRRRSRGYHDSYETEGRSHRDYEPENRRGRSRGYHEEYDRPQHRVRPDYEDHYPDYPEPRRMGYVHNHGGGHEGMEPLKKGYASLKKLAPNLEGVLEDAAGVLEETPKTWKPYLNHDDFAGIVKMEAKELLAAVESGKSPKEMRKELVHTLAALFQAIEK